MAAKYRLSFDQGTTWSRVLTITTDGTPWNLTGYAARLQVRDGSESSTPIINLTNASGLTIGDELGTITISRSATQTAGYAAGNYVYDLELVSPTGEVTRLLQGPFTIDREVTR